MSACWELLALKAFLIAFFYRMLPKEVGGGIHSFVPVYLQVRAIARALVS